ncbi:MAG: glycoside hydrolase domain-containing protein [Gemmatimonadaceae bacterium]
MTESRNKNMAKQATRLLCIALTAVGLVACRDSTGPNPSSTRAGHPGFDTSIYPGDAAMAAWLAPNSPYEWVGYYLQAPCHRDASWMGKRVQLTSMGWGLAVLYVGQQTFDGVALMAEQSRQSLLEATGPIPARAGIMVPATRAEIQAAAVTCSRTLLTTEQGSADAVDAVTRTAAEGFPAGTVVFLDIEHMDMIPASMHSYYRAWVQQVLADGRFRPGIYVHKANAQAIYDGVRQAYLDMNAGGSAAFWLAGSGAFTLDVPPTQVGFAFANVWQGVFEVTQTWNGAAINIDVDVADRSSPSGL